MHKSRQLHKLGRHLDAIALTLKLTNTWSFQAGLMLGSDVFFDPADVLTGMGDFKWAPPDGRNSVLFSFIIGPGRFNQERNFNNPDILDLVYTHQFNPRLNYNFETLVGYQNHVPDIGTAYWFGVLNYLSYTFTPRLGATTRVEFFDDAQGQRTGYKGYTPRSRRACRSSRARRSLSVPKCVSITTTNLDHSRTNTDLSLPHRTSSCGGNLCCRVGQVFEAHHTATSAWWASKTRPTLQVTFKDKDTPMHAKRTLVIPRLYLIGCISLQAPLAMCAADAPTPAPAVTITLGTRHAHATPDRKGFTHTGGGNIDVAQPSPDTLVITMTGVAVAGAQPCGDSVASLRFDLSQAFEVAFEKPEVKKAKLTLEARVIGLLRSPCKGGSAEVGPAHSGVTSGPVEIIGLDIASHAVAAGENLSINDHEGPNAVSIDAGKFTLNEVFAVTAAHPRTLRLSKAASAEFAPDPALDPLWISYWEPFHGAGKKDFGFQLTFKVAPE